MFRVSLGVVAGAQEARRLHWKSTLVLIASDWETDGSGPVATDFVEALTVYSESGLLVRYSEGGP